MVEPQSRARVVLLLLLQTITGTGIVAIPLHGAPAIEVLQPLLGPAPSQLQALRRARAAAAAAALPPPLIPLLPLAVDAFYINLQRRPDRRARFEAQIHALQLERALAGGVRRFDAIDGKALNAAAAARVRAAVARSVFGALRTNAKSRSNTNLTPGSAALAVSHRSVWEEALRLQRERSDAALGAAVAPLQVPPSQSQSPPRNDAGTMSAAVMAHPTVDAPRNATFMGSSSSSSSSSSSDVNAARAILVFEDDARLHPLFVRELASVLAQLRTVEGGWDVCALGVHNSDGYDSRADSDEAAWASRATPRTLRRSRTELYGLFGYLVNPAAVGKLSAALFPLSSQVRVECKLV